MSLDTFTTSPLLPLPPPPPPLNNNTHEGVPLVAALPNLASTPNANVDNFGSELFVSLPRTADSDDVQLMDEFERPDESDTAPRAPTCLFTLGSTAALLLAVEGNKAESALEANFRVFPSQVTTLTNRFTNQDEDLNDNGYNSDEISPTLPTNNSMILKGMLRM
jgi:hypothetical protein